MSDEGMSGEMLERYARGEASVPIPTFTRDVYRHLLARLDAAERERDAAKAEAALTKRTFIRYLGEQPNLRDVMQAGIAEGLATGKADRDALREALTQIASFEDSGANRRLSATGSYSAFDEPGSVEIARAALTANHSAPQEQQP